MKPSKQDVDSAIEGLERIHSGLLPGWAADAPGQIVSDNACIVCGSHCKPTDAAIVVCDNCNNEVGEVLVPALERAYRLGRLFGHDVAFNSFHVIATRQSEECAKLRQSLHDARQSAIACSEDHLAAVARERAVSGELAHEKGVSILLFFMLLASGITFMAYWLLR